MADGGLEMTLKPTENISVRETFGFDTDMVVKALRIAPTVCLK